MSIEVEEEDDDDEEYKIVCIKQNVIKINYS